MRKGQRRKPRPLDTVCRRGRDYRVLKVEGTKITLKDVTSCEWNKAEPFVIDMEDIKAGEYSLLQVAPVKTYKLTAEELEELRRKMS